jgi:hypothetical protein
MASAIASTSPNTSATSCCEHCVFNVAADFEKKRAEKEREQPADPGPVVAAPLPAPVRRQPKPADKGRSCSRNWIWNPLTWGARKTASILAGSITPQIAKGCSGLAIKTISRLKDIHLLPQAISTIHASMTGNEKISAIKDILIGQVSNETLMQFSACSESIQQSFMTMPSATLLTACMIDTIVSKMLNVCKTPSWLTTSLRVAGTVAVCSNILANSTLIEVGEFAIGYTAYLAADGLCTYYAKPQALRQNK